MVTAVDATSKRYRRHGRRAGLVGIMVRRARACLTVAAAWRRTPALTDRRSLSPPARRIAGAHVVVVNLVNSRFDFYAPAGCHDRHWGC